MSIFERTPWKDKTDKVVSKDDFLNGLDFEEVSHPQQMFYLLYKKIEELEARIVELENR